MVGYHEHAKPVENAGAFELVPLLFRIAVGDDP
jgi:hypothetical protein